MYRAITCRGGRVRGPGNLVKFPSYNYSRIKLQEGDIHYDLWLWKGSTKGQAKDGSSLEAQERLLRHGAEAIYMDSFTGTKITNQNLTSY